MEKTLLITGASSDTGLSYIRRYHTRYDKIVGTYYLHKDGLEALKAEIGDKLIIYQVNLLKINEVEEFALWMKDNNIFPLYVLHLPALKSPMNRITDGDIMAIKDAIEVDVISIMSLLKSIVPLMEEENFGRICFMLSSVTKNVTAFQNAYIISKYALLGAMKALATELAAKGITVNAVSPSMMDTKYIEDVSPLAKKKRLSGNPLKRLVTTEDVIISIAHFLDEENSFVTGENLLIAGGGIIS